MQALSSRVAPYPQTLGTSDSEVHLLPPTHETSVRSERGRDREPSKRACMMNEASSPSPRELAGVIITRALKELLRRGEGNLISSTGLF